MPAHGQRIYLAYGSNLHPDRLEARVGRAQLLGVVRLPGWCLRFEKRGGDGSAKANLHAAPGAEQTAWAAAYSLRPEQVGRLDVFEGCGSGYETLPMTISMGQKRIEAFTYLAPAQWISRDLLPFDWYVELIVHGARHHHFDASYIEHIVAHPDREDPDHRRAKKALRGMNLPLPTQYKR
ncbi:MAG TPA: gamma-glutamylcyclotransferase family protein [Wenzhouxiangella sp.]|nr:gamma-glutamylcyclotransferase family protein [Wenzhouxiangella sp.]